MKNKEYSYEEFSKAIKPYMVSAKEAYGAVRHKADATKQELVDCITVLEDLVMFFISNHPKLPHNTVCEKQVIAAMNAEAKLVGRIESMKDCEAKSKPRVK